MDVTTSTGALQLALAACAGLGLSAACGFRVFVPVLVAGLAARAELLTLSPALSWLQSDVALVALGVATVLEIGAYFIPWLDNALDTISTPAAVVAGGVLALGITSDMSPVLRWPLAAIAAANTGVIKLAASSVRATSTATTGGVGNFVVSGSEVVGATAASALSVFIPVLAAVIALALSVTGIVAFRRLKKAWADRKARGGLLGWRFGKGATACAAADASPAGAPSSVGADGVEGRNG